MQDTPITPVTTTIHVTRPPRPEDYQSPRFNWSAAIIAAIFTTVLVLLTSWTVLS
jgi:hypothetical protein